jgi:ABC-2 type transport system ATP-binding protein
MRKLGKKRLTLHLEPPLAHLPPQLAAISGLTLADGGAELSYVYDPSSAPDAVPALLEALRGALREAGVRVKDLETSQSSLEEIFVNLVRE